MFCYLLDDSARCSSSSSLSPFFTLKQRESLILHYRSTTDMSISVHSLADASEEGYPRGTPSSGVFKIPPQEKPSPLHHHNGTVPTSDHHGGSFTSTSASISSLPQHHLQHNNNNNNNHHHHHHDSSIHKSESRVHHLLRRIPLVFDVMQGNIRSAMLLCLTYGLLLCAATTYILVVFTPAAATSANLRFIQTPQRVQYHGIPFSFVVLVLDSNNNVVPDCLVTAKLFPTSAFSLELRSGSTLLASQPVNCPADRLVSRHAIAHVNSIFCKTDNEEFTKGDTVKTDEVGVAKFDSLTQTFGFPGSYTLTVSIEFNEQTISITAPIHFEVAAVDVKILQSPWTQSSSHGECANTAEVGPPIVVAAEVTFLSPTPMMASTPQLLAAIVNAPLPMTPVSPYFVVSASTILPVCASLDVTVLDNNLASVQSVTCAATNSSLWLCQGSVVFSDVRCYGDSGPNANAAVFFGGIAVPFLEGNFSLIRPRSLCSCNSTLSSLHISSAVCNVSASVIEMDAFHCTVSLNRPAHGVAIFATAVFVPPERNTTNSIEFLEKSLLGNISMTSSDGVASFTLQFTSLGSVGSYHIDFSTTNSASRAVPSKVEVKTRVAAMEGSPPIISYNATLGSDAVTVPLKVRVVNKSGVAIPGKQVMLLLVSNQTLVPDYDYEIYTPSGAFLDSDSNGNAYLRSLYAPGGRVTATPQSQLRQVVATANFSVVCDGVVLGFLNVTIVSIQQSTRKTTFCPSVAVSPVVSPGVPLVPNAYHLHFEYNGSQVNHTYFWDLGFYPFYTCCSHLSALFSAALPEYYSTTPVYSPGCTTFYLNSSFNSRHGFALFVAPMDGRRNYFTAYCSWTGTPQCTSVTQKLILPYDVPLTVEPESVAVINDYQMSFTYSSHFNDSVLTNMRSTPIGILGLFFGKMHTIFGPYKRYFGFGHWGPTCTFLDGHGTCTLPLVSWWTYNEAYLLVCGVAVSPLRIRVPGLNLTTTAHGSATSHGCEYVELNIYYTIQLNQNYPHLDQSNVIELAVGYENSEMGSQENCWSRGSNVVSRPCFVWMTSNGPRAPAARVNLTMKDLGWTFLTTINVTDLNCRLNTTYTMRVMLATGKIFSFTVSTQQTPQPLDVAAHPPSALVSRFPSSATAGSTRSVSAEVWTTAMLLLPEVIFEIFNTTPSLTTTVGYVQCQSVATSVLIPCSSLAINAFGTQLLFYYGAVDVNVTFPVVLPSGLYNINFLTANASLTLGTVNVGRSGCMSVLTGNPPSVIVVGAPLLVNVQVLCSGVATPGVLVSASIRSANWTCFGAECGSVQLESSFGVTDSSGIANLALITTGIRPRDTAYISVMLPDVEHIASTVLAAQTVGVSFTDVDEAVPPNPTQAVFSSAIKYIEKTSVGGFDYGPLPSVNDVANIAIVSATIIASDGHRSLSELYCEIEFDDDEVDSKGKERTDKEISDFSSWVSYSSSSASMTSSSSDNGEAPSPSQDEENTKQCSFRATIQIALTSSSNDELIAMSDKTVMIRIVSAADNYVIPNPGISCHGCVGGLSTNASGFVTFDDVDVTVKRPGEYQIQFSCQGVHVLSQPFVIVSKEENELHEAKESSETALMILFCLAIPVFAANTPHTHPLLLPLTVGLGVANAVMTPIIMKKLFSVGGALEQSIVVLIIMSACLAAVALLLCVLRILQAMGVHWAHCVDDQARMQRAYWYTMHMITPQCPQDHQHRQAALDEEMEKQEKSFRKRTTRRFARWIEHHTEGTALEAFGENLIEKLEGEWEQYSAVAFHEPFREPPEDLQPSIPSRVFIVISMSISLCLVVLRLCLFAGQYVQSIIGVIAAYCEAQSNASITQTVADSLVTAIKQSIVVIVTAFPSLNLGVLQQLDPLLDRINFVQLINTMEIIAQGVYSYFMTILYVAIGVAVWTPTVTLVFLVRSIRRTMRRIR